ncbi:unnamed protein product [Tilletia controversa]|uniref:Uncharacterized protein n=1 Tax=Tilletia caries TaxID=13290 RepID=A0ABN7JBE1_9BASI|nr:unnamed protein product [Tilletia controversa]CAD6924006.1 unnamed protein product [Tilletia laevis]CAD6958494.1 unnamed protein product [Tilletia caries]CAD6912111.1 unnamed protein product [Tilletia controversa]CAD6934538.1 unnamed protein product [Tilletia controversa]
MRVERSVATIPLPLHYAVDSRRNESAEEDMHVQRNEPGTLLAMTHSDENRQQQAINTARRHQQHHSPQRAACPTALGLATHPQSLH